MKAKELVLRCYGKRSGDQYVVVCIDLCLAAQADSMKEARAKLLGQMSEYLNDALSGEDQEYADYLLTRKAPFSQVATYYFVKSLHHIHALKNGAYQLFSETLPLQPKFG